MACNVGWKLEKAILNFIRNLSAGFQQGSIEKLGRALNKGFFSASGNIAK